MRLYISIICLIVCSNCSAQSIFVHQNPSFTIVLENNWKEYTHRPQLLVYAKFLRVHSGIVGGNIRIASDIILGKIESAWDIDPEMYKKQFLKEGIVKNFRSKKTVIAGRKALKIELDMYLESNKDDVLKSTIYSFIYTENNKTSSIWIGLMSSNPYYDVEIKEFERMVSTFEIDKN